MNFAKSKLGCIGALLLMWYVYYSAIFDSQYNLIGFDFFKLFNDIGEKYNYYLSHAKYFSKTINAIVDVGNSVVSTGLSLANKVFGVIEMAYEWLFNNVGSKVANAISNGFKWLGGQISNIFS